jgi:hypothetical protein
MKQKFIAYTIALVLATITAFSQTTLKEYKAGHIFNISLPDYMNKTSGLNTSATIQYKSEVKDVYGFVIVDVKEDLQLVEMNYASIKDFHEDFIKDFLKGLKKRNIS